MQRITTTIAFCFLLVLLAGETNAQAQGRFPMLRERVANARLNEIGKRMGLEKAKVEALRPVYHQFEKEKAGLFDGLMLRGMQTLPDSLSDEQAEKLYFLQIEKTRKLMDIREKYYHEFRKVLTPKQIIRFQKVEMEVNRKLLQDTRQRFRQRIPEQER